MTFSIIRKPSRPLWMTPFGHEGLGNVFFDRLWPEWRRDMGEEWTPSVDFVEKDGKYHITAEVPGMKKDDISVSIDDGTVTISGKKESKKEEEGTDYYIRETSHGSFTRSFKLPAAVDEEKVDATYCDGVLTVVMPKKEDQKTKKIEVH